MVNDIDIMVWPKSLVALPKKKNETIKAQLHFIKNGLTDLESVKQSYYWYY